MNTNPYLSKNVPIWRDAQQLVVAVEQMLRQLSRYYKYTLGTELGHMNIYVLSHTSHQASYFSGLQRLLEKHRGLSIFYNMNNGPLLPKWQNRCLGRFSAQCLWFVTQHPNCKAYVQKGRQCVDAQNQPKTNPKPTQNQPKTNKGKTL